MGRVEDAWKAWPVRIEELPLLLFATVGLRGRFWHLVSPMCQERSGLIDCETVSSP